MIIDAHTHIGVPFSGPAATYFGIKQGAIFTAEDLIRNMDRFNVDMSVTFPLVSPAYYLEGWMPINRYVADAQKKYPDRIIGFCWLNPKEGRKAIDDLETCVNKLGLRGVKLGPRYDGYFANDPAFDPFYKRVSELGVPIIYHSGPSGVNSAVSICNVADKFPDLTIIVGHLSVWWEELTVTSWLMAKYKNVYGETSGSLSAISIQRAVEALGADHVLYGTDAPYIEVEIEKKRVELADITAEQRKLVFGENTARILKVK